MLTKIKFTFWVIVSIAALLLAFAAFGDDFQFHENTKPRRSDRVTVTITWVPKKVLSTVNVWVGGNHYPPYNDQRTPFQATYIYNGYDSVLVQIEGLFQSGSILIETPFGKIPKECPLPRPGKFTCIFP
jgi:hypothetical protein